MNPVFLNFSDNEGKITKTFSTCSLKTGLMDNIFDIAEKADGLEKGELDLKEARQFFKDLKAIIVEVFGNQFSFEELNKNVEQAEVMKVFKDLCSRLSGEMTKN